MSEILENEIKKVLLPFLDKDQYYISTIKNDMIYFDTFEDSYATSFAFKFETLSLQKYIHNDEFPYRHITFKDGGWEELYETKINYNYISEIIDLVCLHIEDEYAFNNPIFELTFTLKGESEKYNIKASRVEDRMKLSDLIKL